MSMDNLIGGSIWDEYSNKVAERMNNPLNMGEITQEEADEMDAKLIVADFGAESCGDAVRLYWAVDLETDVILRSKFKSFGCGTAVASSDVMAELCIGKTVDQAVKITNIDVEFAMRDNPETPAVPPQKMHCSPYFMPVQTPKGKKPIGEVKEGEEVAVYTQNGLENAKVKRVLKHKVPKSDLVRVYMKTEGNYRNGINVYTKNHILLNNKGEWVYVKDLKDGDVLAHVHESELRSYSQIYNNRMFDPKTARKVAKSLKTTTHFRTQKFADQYAALGKPRGSTKGGKNKLERKYEKIFKEKSLPIRFIGDGTLWLRNKKRRKNMNPDFIFENEKKIIEVTTSKYPFRDFEKYKKERVKDLNEIGYDCYIIDDLNFNEQEFHNWAHNGYIISPYRDLPGVHELSPRDWSAIKKNNLEIEIDEKDMVTVYTLEVDHEEHNYIQNGVISKNCSVMAYDVIKKAAAQYKGVDAESFEEEVIVCECARVTLSTLQETIKLNNLTTIEEIVDYTKAGGFCKSCIKPGGHEEKDIYLVDLLDVQEDGSAHPTQGEFDKLGTVRKLRIIEEVIDKNIRMALHMDGGDLEIEDIRDNDSGGTDVFIRYLGACHGCASSSTGTLFAITSVLQEKVSEKIRVFEV